MCSEDGFAYIYTSVSVKNMNTNLKAPNIENLVSLLLAENACQCVRHMINMGIPVLEERRAREQK